MRKIIVLFSLILLLVNSGYSQSSTSSLRGRVLSSGVPMAAVEVMLVNSQLAISRSTKTDAQGNYQFQQLPPASYIVKVEMGGVKQEQMVTLLVSTSTALDIEFPAGGSQSETATERVKAENGKQIRLNTQDATLGNPFELEQIRSLPFEGRSAVEPLTLQAGAGYLGNNLNADFDSRSGSISGSRSDQANIMIDGIDNNIQTTGLAYSGALRVSQEMVQEFRVVTAGGNAESGRSSGAQVSIVTRGGTNDLHGSAYEFHRPTFTTANDWFNKNAQLRDGRPNKPGQLVRDTFGASFGGPIKKDRVFYFADYEGQRTDENTQVTRIVPSASLRAGVVQYLTCATSPNCAAGGGNTVVSLTSAQFAAMDPKCAGLGTCPLGPGINPVVLASYQKYPLPNTDIVGDGLNYRGYTFSASAPASLNTGMIRLDANLTPYGTHRIFFRGNLQDDAADGRGTDGPQFPGDDPNLRLLNNSRGFGVGYDAVLTANLFSTLRYGFTRYGLKEQGIRNGTLISGNPDDLLGTRSSTAYRVLTNQIGEDLTWTKLKHTIQWGGVWKRIENSFSSDRNSYNVGLLYARYAANSGFANVGGSFDPGVFGFPSVAQFYAPFYNETVTSAAGLISLVFQHDVRDGNGNVQPQGALIKRDHRNFEAEFYVQDSWHVAHNFTITAGLRYTLLQTPYEKNGLETGPALKLSDWVSQREAAARKGMRYDQPFSFIPIGKANNGRPYWDTNKDNFAPRIAFAWSPKWKSRTLTNILGGEGKSVLRGGFGIYYDHFGQQLINNLYFNDFPSQGLVNTEGNPPLSLSGDTAPRVANFGFVPSLIPTVVNGFPYKPPSDFEVNGAAIYDQLRTPYSESFNLSYSRELPHSLVLETSYVGRLGHHQLVEENLAQGTNIIDPVSGMTVLQARQQLAILSRANTNITSVAPIAFFENIFPTAKLLPALPSILAFNGKQCSVGAPPATPTATQMMFDWFSCFKNSELLPLVTADTRCFPACATLGGSTQPFAFNSPQYNQIRGPRSIGNSSYHAAQVTVRGQMRDLFFHLNYTLSHSIDYGSNAERVIYWNARNSPTRRTGFTDFIQSSEDPRQSRASSRFDARHQINFSYDYKLPFGNSEYFGSNWRTLTNSILGKWQFSGIYRWTSGFPFSVDNGSFLTLSTNSFALLSGTAPTTGQYVVNGIPTVFEDPKAAYSAFQHNLPANQGPRNNLTGPGYFEWDAALSKTWKITERQALRFSWEVFNVTNSVRFTFEDGRLPSLDQDPSSFGTFNATLTHPRAMQFGLRYSF